MRHEVAHADPVTLRLDDAGLRRLLGRDRPRHRCPLSLSRYHARIIGRQGWQVVAAAVALLIFAVAVR